MVGAAGCAFILMTINNYAAADSKVETAIVLRRTTLSLFK